MLSPRSNDIESGCSCTSDELILDHSTNSSRLNRCCELQKAEETAGGEAKRQEVLARGKDVPWADTLGGPYIGYWLIA